MGSWAEGCCISNLEIDQNTDIVICYIKKNKHEDLNSGAFGIYRPVTPLLRGKYDDYGGCDVDDTPENIALFEAALRRARNEPEFVLATDEDSENGLLNINGDEGPVGCAFWMARLDALEMLRTLRPEFVMDPKKIKRIADGEREMVAELMARLPEVAAEKEMNELLGESRAKRRAEKNAAAGVEATPDEITVSVRTSTKGFGGGPKIVADDGDEVIGHGCGTVAEAERYCALLLGHVKYDDELQSMRVTSKNRFNDEHMLAYGLATRTFNHKVSADSLVNEFLLLTLYDGDAATQALCIKHLAELGTLQWGLGQLRKALLPLFRTGPQYDGWLAVEDFVKYLTLRIKAEKAERVASARESQEFMRRYKLAVEGFKAKNDGRTPNPTEIQAAMKEIA